MIRKKKKKKEKGIGLMSDHYPVDVQSAAESPTEKVNTAPTVAQRWRE